MATGNIFMGARPFLMLLAATIVAGVMQVALAKTSLLTHVSLQWRPTTELKVGTMDVIDVPIHIDTFQDVRDNKEAIGENLEDNEPRPVTTTDNVGAFVSSHVSDLFRHAGLKMVDRGSEVTIQGEVRQFFVRETTTYKSQLTVHLTVMGQDGTKLWSGIASGEANRFGRSYKLENYNEVLSDAIVNAVMSMLQSKEFQRALSGRKAE
jgi:hypothetical protein